MAKTECVQTTVKIKIMVEVTATNYDAKEWKISDITEQAGREARERVSKVLGQSTTGIQVIGEPEVEVVTSKLL
jgi:hypothetical protein